MVFQGAAERGLVIEFHNGCLPLGGLCVIWNGCLKFFLCKWVGLLKIYIFWLALLIYTLILDKKGNLHHLTNSKIIKGGKKK